MNKPNSFVGQIRQPPSIGGRQVINPGLIKTSQGGGSPDSVNKKTHSRMYTCITSTQFSISSPRKSDALIKGFNSRMVNWLQADPVKSQWKVLLKSATKISNGLRTRLILFFSETEGPTLRQMLSTTLVQQVLQNSTINKGVDYVARACLALIAPQDG